MSASGPGNATADRMSAPMIACCLTWSYSSAVSGPGLCEQPIGNAELADVVQQRGGVDRLEHPVVADADLVGERDGVALDALRVLVRRPVARSHRARQRLDHRRGLSSVLTLSRTLYDTRGH